MAKRPPGWIKWDPGTHPGTCQVCQVPFTKLQQKIWACWDHCHTCGAFRGWLCNLCNNAEGLVRFHFGPQRCQSRLRSATWRAKLAKYLETHACLGPPGPKR